MNFRKLPKDKRNQLLLVIVITVGIMGGLGFGLIKYQYSSLHRLAGKQTAAEAKLAKMRDAIKFAGRMEADLTEARKTLAEKESDMASGDVFSWVYNTLRKFKTPYKVEIPQFSPIGPTSPMSLLPNFPYQQATLTVAGTAHYHDLGRFLADFENQFPHIRVLNLTLDVNSGTMAEDPELLSFRMEIVTLVKPNAS